jgi:predicted RNase H-like nuclease (RuvC/YqgF family)
MLDIEIGTESDGVPELAAALIKSPANYERKSTPMTGGRTDSIHAEGEVTSALYDQSVSENIPAESNRLSESGIKTLLGQSFFDKLSQMSQDRTSKDNKDSRIKEYEGKALSSTALNEKLKSEVTELKLELQNTIDTKDKELKNKAFKMAELKSRLDTKRQNIASLEREVQGLRRVKIKDKLESRDQSDELRLEMEGKVRENEALMEKVKE